MKIVYGPVPSWRLGRSLGVDPLGSGMKRCAYDCVYCQLGRTPGGPIRSGAWADPDVLANEIRATAHVPADYVTFSGMGEPTLASNLGELLQVARATRKTRLAVLTNASLLLDPDVRAALRLADCVVAKLDAADEEAFLSINRPRIPCSLAEVVGGIRQFREEFAGRLALQMMFLAANAGQAQRLAILAWSLEPDEIQLNTLLRPSPVPPLQSAAMAVVARAFGCLPARQVSASARPAIVALDPVATRHRADDTGEAGPPPQCGVPGGRRHEPTQRGLVARYGRALLTPAANCGRRSAARGCCPAPGRYNSRRGSDPHDPLWLPGRGVAAHAARVRRNSLARRQGPRWCIGPGPRPTAAHPAAPTGGIGRVRGSAGVLSGRTGVCS